MLLGLSGAEFHIKKITKKQKINVSQVFFSSKVNTNMSAQHSILGKSPLPPSRQSLYHSHDLHVFTLIVPLPYPGSQGGACDPGLAFRVIVMA